MLVTRTRSPMRKAGAAVCWTVANVPSSYRTPIRHTNVWPRWASWLPAKPPPTAPTTVATIVGAIGGGYAGNQLAQRGQTVVWRIGVRYDDGAFATVQQTAAPGLRVGDRVRVTNTGIELLRG